MPEDYDDDVGLEGAEESAPPAGKSKTGLLLILMIGVLIVIVGAVVAFFLIKNVKSDGSGPATTRVEQQPAEPLPEPRGTPIQYRVGDIYVNVRGTRSTRVLKLTPVLEVSEQRTREELGEFSAILKDRIATVARGMTFDELDGVNGPDRLKQEIRDTLNRQLRTRLRGYIIAVHFEDFLIQ